MKYKLEAMRGRHTPSVTISFGCVIDPSSVPPVASCIWIYRGFTHKQSVNMATVAWNIPPKQSSGFITSIEIEVSAILALP
jgi:hypothetical protein